MVLKNNAFSKTKLLKQQQSYNEIENNYRAKVVDFS